MKDDFFSPNYEHEQPEYCQASITINGTLYTCHQVGTFHEGPHVTRVQVDRNYISGFEWDITDEGLILDIPGEVMKRLYEWGQTS